jgi:hypothetical protein
MLNDTTSINKKSKGQTMPKPKKETTTVAVDTSASDASVDTSSVDLSKIQADFVFRAPIEMRMKADEAAAAAKLPIAQYLRNIVAQALGYTLPTENARASTLTEEEKKAKLDAQRAKEKAQRALTRELLKAHKEEQKTNGTA